MELINPEMHSAHINNAAVSVDGKYFSTVSDDVTAKIWNAENLELLHTFIQ